MVEGSSGLNIAVLGVGVNCKVTRSDAVSALLRLSPNRQTSGEMRADKDWGGGRCQILGLNQQAWDRLRCKRKGSKDLYLKSGTDRT